MTIFIPIAILHTRFLKAGMFRCKIHFVFPLFFLAEKHIIFSICTGLFDCHRRNRYHSAVYVAGRLRAYRNTTHAGYTLFAVRLLWGFFADCLCRAAFCATAAGGTIMICFRDQARPAGFFIGAVPRDLRGGQIRGVTVDFCKDLFGKTLQLCFILPIRPARRILMYNGMLCDGGNPGNHFKAALYCDVI